MRMKGCIRVRSVKTKSRLFTLLLKEIGSERMQRRPLEILLAGHTEREKILQGQKPITNRFLMKIFQGRLQEETQW
nr:uncharacterized protein LOC111838940 isoform X3 [Paramormyrops kingsleyae]